MRSDARKRLAEEQDSEPCEDCGKPLNSFACKIRHQQQPIIGWGRAAKN